MSLASADQPVLVVAPANPHLEHSCRYARGADMRSLVDDTERALNPPWEADLLTIGVDLGVGDSFSAIFKQVGTTTGRTQSRGPNLQQMPRGNYTRHRPKIVDYLNLLGPIQSGAADMAASKTFHEKMKELLKDAHPLTFAPPLMDQPCTGIQPGELYLGLRSGDTRFAAMNFYSKEQKLIDETEQKLLGIDVSSTAYFDTEFNPFKSEIMGLFPEPGHVVVAVADESGRTIGHHTLGSWGPNNGELDDTSDTRIRREEDDADEPH